MTDPEHTVSADVAPAYDDLSFLPVSGTIAEDAPPPFEGNVPPFAEAMRAWVDYTASRGRLVPQQQLCDDLDHELQTETARLKEFEEKNSSLFNKARKVTKAPLAGLKQMLGTSNTDNRSHSSGTAFAESYPDEAKQRTKVESLENTLSEAKRELRDIQEIVGKEELLFQRLSLAASDHFTGIHENKRLSLAVRDLNEAETEVHKRHDAVVDLTRARLTAQHAHMYHKQVLDVSDRVRSKKFNMVSMISPMNLVEMEEDHRQGVRESVRAQACLNETLRLLDKHSELVPQEISPEASRARELGVGQITKMYNLLYGNTGRGSDVAQQMDTLSQRQEEAFACLTKLAVWLQTTVPQCEQGGKDAKEARYQARTALASTWAAME